MLSTDTGTPMVEFSASGRRCDTGMLHRFTQFLRYLYPAHPRFLSRIEAGGRMPSVIRFHVTDKGFSPFDGVTFEILVVEDIPDAPLSLEECDCAAGKGARSSLDETIDQLMTGSPPSMDQVSSRRRDEVHRFADERKRLEAALSYLEMIIETGSAPDTLRKLVGIDSDARVMRLFQALDPKTTESSEDAVRTLQDLQAETSHGMHVLSLFEAGARAKLGQVDEAISLLGKAIEVNPCLVGAYKDLGVLHTRKHRLDEAWRCWLAALRILGDHPMLRDVRQVRETLLTQHSDFF